MSNYNNERLIELEARLAEAEALLKDANWYVMRMGGGVGLRDRIDAFLAAESASDET